MQTTSKIGNQIKFYNITLKTFLILALIFCSGLISSCATFNNDPWEKVNRPIHKFNEGLDYVLKPSAEVYRDTVPKPIRNSINNFYANLNEPYSFINSLLQGRFRNAGKNLGRFFINSTIGILGLFDVAGKDLEIKATQEDFGQTLGVWGINTGPYLIIPFLGPSNLRDTVSKFGVDRQINTLPQKFDGSGNTYYLMQFFHGVRIRERYLDTEKLVQGMALDKYILYRGIFKQNRLNQVYNGNPPKTPEQEEDESWLEDY